jgi:hypothetical protein
MIATGEAASFSCGVTGLSVEDLEGMCTGVTGEGVVETCGDVLGSGGSVTFSGDAVCSSGDSLDG